MTEDLKLPAGWKLVKLGEIAERIKEVHPNGSQPYLEIGDIDIKSKRYTIKEKSSPEHCLKVRKNYIVISKVRPMRGAIAKIKEEYLYVSPALLVLNSDNNDFLFYALSKEDFFNYLGTRETGTTYPSVNDRNVLDFEFLLPSISEQRKIAEILETVDETIKKTDLIIEKYKRIKQGLMQDLLTRGITAFEFEKDKLIAAIKKVFDSGDHRFGREENLVSHLSRHLNEFFPGWDVDSEVEKNNDRQRPDIIIHKRRMDENFFAIEVKKNENLNAIKQDIEKLEDVMLGDYHYEDAIFIGFDIENFEDVFKLSEKVNFILVSKNGEIKIKSRIREFRDSPLGKIPEEWEVVNIKNICKVRQGLQIAIANRFKESGPKRYIYITIQYLNSEEKDKDAEYIQNPPKSVLCGKNDLLMTRTGNTGMVISDVEGVFHNNFFLVDYYKKQVNKIYLFYYLNLPWIQEEIKALAGTTTIPDLNHSDFYSLKFLKSPLSEQRRIAGVLFQMDETIEKEQRYKEKLERIKQGLTEDLLTGEVRANHLIKEGVGSV
ncbi:MAG: restriction endonuclease subunit S [Actinomycetia bacterium]|nr:restriction endonuclease subunit S [bacterium]MBU4510038.1 restriction endonuclease subunit S [bacterium]MCG2790720.1 restriction endonuclease subunit S [Actinomycetes bacterium]